MSDFAPVAGRIEGLFVRRWPSGYRGANAIVADFVSRAVGRQIDRQYIYRLRTGKVRRVDVPVLEAIGDYFGETLDYFSGTGQQQSREAVDLEGVLQKTGFALSGLRTRGSLTDEAKRELARLLTEARRVIDEDRPSAQQ